MIVEKQKINELFKKYTYYTKEQIIYDLMNNKGFGKEEADEILDKIEKIKLNNLLAKQIYDNDNRNDNEKFIDKNGVVSIYRYLNYYCTGMFIIRARRFLDYWFKTYKTSTYEQYFKESWEWGIEPLHRDLWDKAYDK